MECEVTCCIPIREAMYECVTPALFFDHLEGGALFVEELTWTSIADVGEVKINLKA
jgi:hypothetical protein